MRRSKSRVRYTVPGVDCLDESILRTRLVAGWAVVTKKTKLRPYRLKPRSYPCHEILYIDQGELKTWVGRKCYIVKQGDLFVYPAGLRFGTELPRNTKADMVLINYPGLDAATRRASGLHGGFGIHDGGLLADTLKLAAPDETGAVVLPAERLLPLLNALAEYGKQAPRSAARHTRAQRQSIVNRARAFLDSHIEQRVTLAALARASGASPFHLSRIFHQLTRQSIKDYVAERRTFRAKQLLSNGQLNVGQVARELGFSTVSYFSRFFKLHAGVTPTEYARRLTG